MVLFQYLIWKLLKAVLLLHVVESLWASFYSNERILVDVVVDDQTQEKHLCSETLEKFGKLTTDCC